MIVDSAVAEGKEEVVQGILDRANQNLILGQKMPLASLTDRNAVLSVPAAAEEFGTGAFVGGILSGGQVAAHGVQSHAKLVAEGYARLRSGEMPNAAQLNAMGLNEAEARGKIVLFQMEKMDDAETENHSEQISSLIHIEFGNILELAADGGKITLSEEMESFIADKPFYEIEPLSGKLPNRAVRKWYLSHDAAIKTEIDLTGSLEQQARQAFDLRNLYRTQARDLMDDQNARAELDKTDPNKTFEELVADKMRRKGLTREEALADIISTAGKTRKTINRELGLE